MTDKRIMINIQAVQILALILTMIFLSPNNLQSQKVEIDDVLKILEFRAVGPARGGRSTTVTGVDQEPSTFYMGTTGGGLWKTTNYGQSWQNISDGYFQSSSIGAVRVAPSDPNIIYAGTGSDGLRSNVIPGKGVYKSVNAGKSWTFVGLKEAGQIGAVEIDPNNPNRAFVAAIGNAFDQNETRGIYRTTDGGSNWENVLYLSDSVGASDLELAPDDANTIYAGMWRAERKPWSIISGGNEGGIYKSIDGGTNWKKLSNGLPDGLIGKIDFGVCKNEPNMLYALIEAPKGLGGLYKSVDRGEHFELISTEKGLLDRPFYFGNVDVNPLNSNSIYVGSTRFHYSNDGGKTWTKLSTPHGDNHDLWINPNDTSIWIQANDGGANVSLNNGKNWSTQFNQNTAELYQVEVDDQFPYWLYAGQQDNYSTIAVPSLPPYSVQTGNKAYIINTGGCETGPAVPKPGNADIVYSNCKGRFSVFNKKSGQEKHYYVGASNMYGHNPRELEFRFQRVAPIHISPHDSNLIYHASQYLHKTENEGKSWQIISPDLTAFVDSTQVVSGTPITRDITGEEFYSTIYSVKESTIAKGQIWVGANDGPVSLTLDGGQNWTTITPELLPDGARVQTVEPSPHNSSRAFIAAYRYLLGDFRPYIFRTNDLGKRWDLITNGIPVDCPTRVVREDPNHEGLLFAGTECGLFISLDQGENWRQLQNNLPITPITDIKIHRNDLVLSTMGRGFWILDGLHLIYDHLDHNKSDWRLSVPEEAFLMRYPSSNRNSVPYYPAPGLTIDLKIPHGKEFRVNIYNARQELIQVLSNMDSLSYESEKLISQYQNIRPYFSHQIIKDSTGVQRLKWDYRHFGSKTIQGNRSILGPMVSPGRYTIRYSDNEDSIERQVDLKMDQRVEKYQGTTINDLIKQEALLLNIRNLLIKVNHLATKIENSRKNKNELDALKSEIHTDEGRYMKPKLIDQLHYLYNMLSKGDQLPGEDAYRRFEKLQSEYLRIDAAFRSLK